jgi:hypothetical protein
LPDSVNSTLTFPFLTFTSCRNTHLVAASFFRYGALFLRSQNHISPPAERGPPPF